MLNSTTTHKTKFFRNAQKKFKLNGFLNWNFWAIPHDFDWIHVFDFDVLSFLLKTIRRSTNSKLKARGVRQEMQITFSVVFISAIHFHVHYKMCATVLFIMSPDCEVLLDKQKKHRIEFQKKRFLSFLNLHHKNINQIQNELLLS